MKYPIGVQTFEKLRNEGYVYVDKTALVYKMAQEGSCYFLSRPRRFGKSLLLSTLKAYFEGKRDLFQGLAIAELETEWNAYPVLHLDLNAERYTSISELENILDSNLRNWEGIYGCEEQGNSSLSFRFANVIRSARQKTGRGVVVLIDEYDKPLLRTITDKTLQEDLCATLKFFYGVLYTMQSHIKFAILTGISNLGQINIFGDVFDLNDISMHKQYADVCGITEKELHTYFDREVEKLARANTETKEEAYAELRKCYGGYCFAPATKEIYNPCSTQRTLAQQFCHEYWFETGTPTYLVELLKKSDCNLSTLNNIETDKYTIDGVHYSENFPISPLYHSGYLTIKDYDEEFGIYTLGFPNEEVERAYAYLQRITATPLQIES